MSGLKLDFNLEMHDDAEFPFGLYKGSRISEMPTSYLRWAAEWDGVDDILADKIAKELRIRDNSR